MYDLPGFVIGFLFLAVASYFDIFNKRVVPNWLSYSFVVISLAYSLVTEGVQPFKIGVAAAVFTLGYLVYKLGYIGGADVFFLSGLVLLFPLFMGGTPTIISILLASTILMALYLEVRFFAQGIPIKPRVEDKVNAAIWITGYAMIAYLLNELGLLHFSLLAIVVGIISAVFALIKRDMTKSLITLVRPNQIVEEDILAIEEMDRKTVEKLGLSRLLTKDMIRRIKRAKISKVPVYTNLPPYLPFVLIGVLLVFMMNL